MLAQQSLVLHAQLLHHAPARRVVRHVMRKDPVQPARRKPPLTNRPRCS
jgi:hypothetical protein